MLDKTHGILEFNNNKTLANMKLIKQIFYFDKGLQENIDNYVIKTIQKYDGENEGNLKKEVKKNSFYLEEFAKLLDYISSSFSAKKNKINELYTSIRISKVY